MKTLVMDVVNDAIEALNMDIQMEFEEWYPAWMVDENGELMEDPARLKSLRMIFDGVRDRLHHKP